MRTVTLLLLAVAAVVAGAVFAGPAFGEYPHSSSVGAVQHVTLTIAPAGTAMRSERVVGQNFAVQPGVPVRLTITNTTHRAHTFTIKALGLSVLIAPSAAKTVTFTTRGYGVFAWTCLLCPDAHHEASTMQMGGKVYSIIAI